jgi:hypothetical protein
MLEKGGTTMESRGGSLGSDIGAFAVPASPEAAEGSATGGSLRASLSPPTSSSWGAQPSAEGFCSNNQRDSPLRGSHESSADLLDRSRGAIFQLVDAAVERFEPPFGESVQQSVAADNPAGPSNEIRR